MELPSKATHQATREHNVRLVLRALANLGPISRADIARRTQLTRTTVSDVVTQLSGAGLVQEVGRGPSSGGKAPILLQIPRDARQLVGVHVGDGHVRGAIVNLAGDVSHRERVELPARDGASALASLEGLIDRLIGHASGVPLGIGIGTPGIVETATGTVRWAVHLDWRDLRLGPRLQARTGLPVYVANDSQAAALAEWTFGGHSTARAMVAVRVGTGIGAGIVIDDRLYQGDGAGAGEIGHTTVTTNDIRCRCGRTGCLETVASMPATLERVRIAMGAATRPELGEAVEAFHAGRPGVRAAVLESALYIGRALGALIDTLDIRHIVLIGPMTTFGQEWFATVREEAQRTALPLLAERTRITLGNLGPDVQELGAAALLMTAELGLSRAA
ncbi:MAG: ROK family transcriptional regulator [Candidatus Limnocylindrales bacterium]